MATRNVPGKARSAAQRLVSPGNSPIAQKVGKSGAPKRLEAKSRAQVAVPDKGRRTDYEAMERDYRTGSFTDQELGDKYGKSRQAITKMAKTKGWQKDLSDAVRQATKASLIADAATKKVAEQVAKGSDATVDTVLVAAETNKQVILGHRRDIMAARNLLNGMLSELSEVSVNPQKLQNLLTVLESGQDMTQAELSEARDALSDLQRLPTRILSVQRIAQAMTRLQMLERKAFGLDEEVPPPPDELDDLSDEELNRRIEEKIARRRTG